MPVTILVFFPYEMTVLYALYDTSLLQDTTQFHTVYLELNLESFRVEPCRNPDNREIPEEFQNFHHGVVHNFPIPFMYIRFY